jgi:hypothetical protein
MNHLRLTLALAWICIISAGCASIVDGGRDREVRIASTPSDAKVSIYDKKGELLCVNSTPTLLPLRRDHGYFSAEHYKLVFEKPGYLRAEETISSDLNGWYFGNFIFGGLIGLFLVDPATGAMWTLMPDSVICRMTPDAQAPEQSNYLEQLKARVTDGQRDAGKQ